jgi:riboflavin kinase/FMN adenylyltransferase
VHLQIGDDFRFARGREGDVELLTRAGRALGYSVERSESVKVDGVRVSSTAIREALWSGNLALATRMLGRPYRMSGMVVAGRKVGRTLGYPTANVDLRRRQSPVMGIFAVRVSGSAGPIGIGVASVGSRPTFDLVKPLLEVHLFDFSADLYGDYIHVDFIGRVRDEVKFDTVEELVTQMDEDSDIARQLLEV